MKKFYVAIAIAAILLIPFTLKAQYKEQIKRYDFGVKAGLNISSYTGEDSKLIGGNETADPESKLGLNLGCFLTYRFTPMFAVQPELSFSMQGANFTDGELDISQRLNYINISGFGKAEVEFENGAFLGLKVGPIIGLNISANQTTEMNGNEIASAEIPDAAGIVLDAAFGASYNFALGENWFSIEGRYTMGITSLYEKAQLEGGGSVDRSIKNSTISILIGYYFNE